MRREDKVPLLVHLLRNVVGTDKQTVVFVATKHHVEFLSEYVENICCLISHFICRINKVSLSLQILLTSDTYIAL